MSSKFDDLHKQQDDEAYIAKLYQKLAAEPLSYEDKIHQEQDKPSNALDQQILAAAHKAVQSKPQSIKSKRPFYYSFIASAASLVLVFSLVIKQEEQLMLPAVISDESSAGNFELSRQESFSDDSELLEEEKLPTAPRKPILSSTKVQTAQSNQAAEKRVATEQIMRKQRQQSRANEEHKKAKLRAKKEFNKAAKVISAEPAIEQIVVTGSRLSSSQAQSDNRFKSDPLSSFPVNNLTQAQYNEFEAINAKWVLIEEDEQRYIIEISSGEHEGSHYALLKTAFEIPNKVMADKTKKSDLRHWQEIIVK